MKESSAAGKLLSQPGMKPALAVAAFAGILYLTVDCYLRWPVHAQGQTAAPAQALEDELRAANEMKALLDSIGSRLDNIQRLTAALVTVSSIFALALGTFNVVNLKEIKSSAQEQLDQLKADFPALARMNEGVNRVLEDVRRLGYIFDGWDADNYANLSAENRETIRMSEITFYALEFFDFMKSPTQSRDAAEIYMAFGRFYGSQYRSTNEEWAVERAKLHFRKALKCVDPAPREQALSDLGTVCCWHAATLSGDRRTTVLQEARSRFDDACAIRGYNPSALIGRAWVKRRTEGIQKAIEDLDDLVTALAEKKLSEDEKRRYPRTAYFNRACYRAILGQSSQDQTQIFKSSMDDLWKSKEAAISEDKFPLWLANLDAELSTGKDLAPLLRASQVEINTLKDRSAAKPAV